MAQLISVRLSRSDNSPWGFRLQGGKDFGCPLMIQKVNGGSPAEKAGLIAGDSVIKVNNTDVFNLRHKDAQDVIIKAGPSFELTVQRGGSTWKPQVIPTGNVPKPLPTSNNISPVTKTSLAAKKQDFTPIGSSHNTSAKGFNAAQVNGDGPRLVNKQYNSPLGLYSEESIAETLSAQAEVLSTGALGVNFKKNEKTYNAANSEVLKMLQESEKEKEVQHTESACVTSTTISSEQSQTETETKSEVVSNSVSTGATGLRHVTAPETKPAPPEPKLPPGQNICADCERLIVGVFVRIKDKNLHVECFKCSTCGTSLKNVGYYNINHKLYCDIHAKLAAKSNPPGPNMVPVTVPPSNKAPAGAISAALASHSLPSPSPLSPSGNQYAPPFQPQPVASLDTTDSTNSSQPKKEEAISNLISALTVARVKQMKDSSTNTNGTYVSEAVIPINNDNYYDVNANTPVYATVNKIKYAPKTGASLTGPKPFSSVGPSAHPVAPVSAPVINAAPKFAPAPAPAPAPVSAPAPAPMAAPEHANEEITNNIIQENNQEKEILMPAISSEMYIPVMDYKNGPKFNSVDLRVPVHVVKDKVNSPDQEVFQINASRSYENSPVEFDGSLRNSVIKTLENGHFKQPPVSIQEVAKSEFVTKDNSDVYATNNIKNSFNNDLDTNDTNVKNSITNLGLADGVHPVCIDCRKEIKRGPFITALGKIWCPEHFICTTPSCRRPLQDMGFVEEQGQLYCEFCFEQYLAPTCSKCNTKIKGDCLNAIGKHFHPECFLCAYCGKLFGNSPFFLEDGLPYCEADWNELFTTKCFACGFPVEAGDRWVEALNNNYHSQCFNCTMCKKNLEGQSFYAKGGRPFCKNHAR